MLDKSIPHIGVIMVKNPQKNYPNYKLPQGYTFELFKDGDENTWCNMQLETGQFESLSEALEYFSEEFSNRLEEAQKSIYFVKSPDEKYVATATLWDGMHFGMKQKRIHWVSVNQAEQGKGLAKALMTKLMDAYSEDRAAIFLYLTSQTWSYKALNLYREFGFDAYRGEKPFKWSGTEEDFKVETDLAWKMIEEKIKDYEGSNLLTKKEDAKSNDEK